MSYTKRALERLWAGEPTPEDVAFAGGQEQADAMREGDWPCIEQVDEQPEPAPFVADDEEAA